MHHSLAKLLLQPQLSKQDVSTLSTMIANGAKAGSGYGPIGLFETSPNKSNIFTAISSDTEILGALLPVLLRNASTVVKREIPRQDITNPKSLIIQIMLEKAPNSIQPLYTLYKGNKIRALENLPDIINSLAAPLVQS
jgi:hypothetical protein